VAGVGVQASKWEVPQSGFLLSISAMSAVRGTQRIPWSRVAGQWTHGIPLRPVDRMVGGVDRSGETRGLSGHGKGGSIAGVSCRSGGIGMGMLGVRGDTVQASYTGRWNKGVSGIEAWVLSGVVRGSGNWRRPRVLVPGVGWAG